MRCNIFFLSLILFAFSFVSCDKDTVTCEDDNELYSDIGSYVLEEVELSYILTPEDVSVSEDQNDYDKADAVCSMFPSNKEKFYYVPTKSELIDPTDFQGAVYLVKNKQFIFAEPGWYSNGERVIYWTGRMISRGFGCN